MMIEGDKMWPKWYRPKRKFDFLERSVDITGFPVETIRAANRGRQISRVRFAIAHVMRDSLGRSYPEIGRSLGRDHATIIYGVEQSRELAKRYPDHANLVDALGMIA